MVLGADVNQLQHEELVEMSPRLRIDNRDNVYKGMKMYDPIEPQNLYSQTHSILEINKCQRRKVIKNFCFPDDVRLAQVNDFE